MLRRLSLIALVVPVLLAAPASAATKEEKMETCKVGAESQNLTGAKLNAFIKRCMAAGNYEPPARKAAMKKTKKPAAKKPAATTAPATDQPAPK